MVVNMKICDNNKRMLLLGAIFVILFVYFVFDKTQPNENNCAPYLSHPSSNFNLNKDSVIVSIDKIVRGEPITLEQDDPRIIRYIWSHKHLEPPSEEPYNLKDTSEDPSRGQGQRIRKILKNKMNGFFIECGALDGETRSNTLFMEQNLGWKGLLIEGDPSNYELMKLKNRKAWMANTCLAVKPHPHRVRFAQRFNQGKILSENDAPQKVIRGTVEVQCMPLFSLLSALNITRVDYFSLDVEGSELQVLKTIPFDKVQIQTLSVEYIHTVEGKEQLLEFMESNGYRVHSEVHYPGGLANDFIFVHNSLDADN